MRSLFRLSLVTISVIIFNVVLYGCNGSASSTPATPPFIYAVLESFPNVLAPANMKNAMVTVRDGASGTSVTDALVAMNGVSLPYNANYHNYEGNVSLALGDRLVLFVMVGDREYTATAYQFTSLPNISAPLSATILSASSEHTISWSGGTPAANAMYRCGVLAGSDPTGQIIWPSTGYLQQVPITTTFLNIPANSLTAGARLVIVGIATVESVPDAAAGSVLALGGYSSIPITVIDN
jgi:hypothetical protein